MAWTSLASAESRILRLIPDPPPGDLLEDIICGIDRDGLEFDRRREQAVGITVLRNDAVEHGRDLLVQTVFALDYLGLFGVALKGTIQSIRDAKEATQILGTMYREKSSDPSLRYPFPVVVLLFSMQDDSGYYAWLVEPVGVREGEPKLKLHGSPNCEPFNRTSLSYLIARVNDWYLKYFKYI